MPPVVESVGVVRVQLQSAVVCSHSLVIEPQLGQAECVVVVQPHSSLSRGHHAPVVVRRRPEVPQLPPHIPTRAPHPLFK